MNPSAARLLPVLLVALLAPSRLHRSAIGCSSSVISHRWTNSLGMVFVAVPPAKVAFAIYETRVNDFAAFAAAWLAAAIFIPWMNISGSVLANYWHKRSAK